MSLVMQSQRFVGSPMMSSSVVHGLSSTREGIRIIKIIKCSTKTDVKNVFWSARKKERVKLPTNDDGFRVKDYPICEFLNHPSGIETVLNINAWKVGSFLVGTHTASMKNHITRDTSASESFLNVDVSLKIHIEIYNQPFPLLRVSAIEVPGNIVTQALLDRFAPLLVQQLLQDYENWVLEQSEDSS